MNLPESLRLHQLWLADDPSGVRFVAVGADLSGADLSCTDQACAHQTSANMR